MKKLWINLILLISIFILTNSSVFAITEQEARKYLDKDVFVVVTHDTSAGIYGRIIDVVEVDGEVNIILDTFYNSGRKLMFLRIECISYIRARKSYESLYLDYSKPEIKCNYNHNHIK